MDVVRLQVLANPEIQTDFDRVVSMFKDFIAQRGSNPGSRIDSAQIAATKDRGGKGKNKRDRGGGSGRNRREDKRARISAVVEDRYYSKDEYNRLSKEDKQKLHQLRRGRGGGGGNNGNHNNGGNNGRNNGPNTAVHVDAVNTPNNGNDDAATVQVNNRNNPALRR
jgi:hypothetical protein